jgi:hypothetical protein
MRPGAALALLLSVFALAGCSNSHRTDRESAEGAVETLLKTCAADRPQASIEVLDVPARQAFARARSPLDGCLAVLGLHPAGDQAAVRRALARSRVVSADANAVGGSAVIQAPDGSRSRVEVENERGDWRVAQAARPSAL